MKSLILLLIILGIQSNDIIAQQRCYTYDAAGNRTQRACNFFRILDIKTQEASNVTPEMVEPRTNDNSITIN